MDFFYLFIYFRQGWGGANNQLTHSIGEPCKRKRWLIRDCWSGVTACVTLVHQRLLVGCVGLCHTGSPEIVSRV